MCVTMRSALALTLAACAAEPAMPDQPGPLETVWGESIRAGDLVVAVPGTGAYTLTGATIDEVAAATPAGSVPLVDVRVKPFNSINLEQAIAAARRAGFFDEEIEAGRVHFTLWGAGVTRATELIYGSYEGLRVPFTVLGGRTVAAEGLVTDNLFNYNSGNADRDASDLYGRIAAWIDDHPSVEPRRVTLVAHSWGGAVSEYLASHLASFHERFGALPRGASLPFVMAAGVPGFIPGYQCLGPGIRTVESGVRVYEVDRPDDMVHNLDPSGNVEGHQYNIMFGDDFRGSYGITTMELSCAGVPGPC
jgi:hypothetical protein